MHFLYLFTCCFFMLTTSHARDWYYGTAINGELREFFGSTDMYSKFLSTIKKDQSYWQDTLSKTEAYLLETQEAIRITEAGVKRNNLQDDYYKLLNNKAHCFISLNKTDEALALLKTIEKKMPGKSHTAENLAFCYENKKDYENALAWIQIAGKRNSMSRYSNIWVYERILMVRKEMQDDPLYLQKNAILTEGIAKDSDLQPFDLSTRENYHRRWKIASKAKHVRERIQLQMQRNPNSKDPVIAMLIEELATIYALCEVCEVALPLYKLALEHGHLDPEMVNRRIQQMERLIAANPKSMNNSRSIFEKISRGAWFLGLSFGLLILLISYLWWKDRSSQKAALK